MSKICFVQTFPIDLVSMTIVMLHSKLHTQKILNLYDKINQVCTGKTFILCNFNYKKMLHGSSSCGAKIHTKCIKYITLKFKKLFQIVNKIKIQIEFKNYLVTKNMIFTHSTYRVFQLLEGQDLK